MVDKKPPVARQAAEDFARFLFETPAQREFAKTGFRVNPKVNKQAADAQVRGALGG